MHMLNQDIHKNLRRNRAGIPIENVEKLSPTYVRPLGFTLVPTLLGTSTGSSNEKPSKTTNGSSYHQNNKDNRRYGQRYEYSIS